MHGSEIDPWEGFCSTSAIHPAIRVAWFLMGLCLLAGFPVILHAAPLSVFVSILPQKYFVERIGGEHVRVSVMVGPGQSPATYAPTPKQMAALSQATVYFRIGVSFEDAWLGRIAQANPEMTIVDNRARVRLHAIEYGARPKHSTPGHTHGRYDPHVWTAPPLVKVIAAQIRDVLVDLDPSHTAEYAANFAEFARDLHQLQHAIWDILPTEKVGRFMVFHPSWGYFADTYGLQQIPLEQGGKEPSAKQLAGLIEQAKHEGMRVIFVQKQFSRRNAEIVARAISGKVIALDPLAEDYLQNMQRVARSIAKGMD